MIASEGIGGRPISTQPTAATGMATTDAATMPVVAARRGSPDDLRRTFQTTCRTAETATRANAAGGTLRVYARALGVRGAAPSAAVPRASRAPPAASAADVAPRISHRGDADPADREHGASDEPER